jgi:hypothetical protein
MKKRKLSITKIIISVLLISFIFLIIGYALGRMDSNRDLLASLAGGGRQVWNDVTQWVKPGTAGPGGLKTAHRGKDLPEFLLKDPRGKAFTRNAILKYGVIFVVTAPILSNKEKQENWAKYLKATKQACKGRLIFLQDMSPCSFQELALSEMKKQSDPRKDPLLLIDPNGEMRRKLGVKKEATIVLAYDKNGRRVHEERGGASQKSASRIWKSLQ